MRSIFLSVLFFINFLFANSFENKNNSVFLSKSTNSGKGILFLELKNKTFKTHLLKTIKITDDYKKHLIKENYYIYIFVKKDWHA